MGTQEFSDSFDIVVNSFSNNLAFGKDNNDIAFNEYEKSLFLTQAQEELAIALYSGKNSNGESFESSEEMRRYLEPLLEQRDKTDAYSTSNKIDKDYYTFKLEDDVLFIVFESVDWNPTDLGCLPYKNIQVVPITHDEYHRVKKNPFRGANNNRVLRLDFNANKSDAQYVELISKYPIANYRYRFIRKPAPIILEDLPDSLTINGRANARTSELHESLHDRILQLAVAKALQSRNIKINNQ